MSEVLSQINSTWLQGTINTDYNTFVKCFGEPDPDHCDNYKSDAEWRVAENAVGYPISIYNWKNGQNYLGERGLPVEEITRWNIGGQNQEDVELVKSIVEARQLVHDLSLEIWDSLAAGHDKEEV